MFADTAAHQADITLPFLPLSTTSPTDTRAVYITAVDFGLFCLIVPRYAFTWALERALLQWLGRQRCLGVRLHQTPHPSLKHVFCLPRRGRPTIVAALVDVGTAYCDRVLVTIDSDEHTPINCDALRDPWRPASAFWNDVLERGSVCLACGSSEAGPSSGSQVVQHAVLGLDFGRALRTGWRPPHPADVPTYDLVASSGHLGLQWGRLEPAGQSQDASTQTGASYWPTHASPLFSAALPVPRRAAGCSFDERYGSEGTLFHLNCPHMHVQCTLPCVAGRHIWALRVGNWVRAACSPLLRWDEILQVAGMTYWDLPGTSIHGAAEVWTWPADVSTLSGQCGHIMHEGSDLCLPATDPAPPSYNERFQVSPPGSPPPERSRGRPIFPLVNALVFMLSFRPTTLSQLVLLGVSLHYGGQAVRTSDTLAPVRYDSTQTCTVAWCHELSCQNTHFAVNPEDLALYFARHAPLPTVQVHVWKPFQGPASFELPRDAPAALLRARILDAGHDPERHVLHVAHDTQATVLDLLSVPPDGACWWIIRDGLSRELLRPVVTINSHGQAVSLATTPEVAPMNRLPQGARGSVATPLTRICGHLAASGLVLAEIAIGTVASWGYKGAPALWMWFALVPVVHGMQSSQVIVPRARAGWHDPPATPVVMRIWTHTLAAPVELPFAETPDPDRLAAAVVSTHRGIRCDGVFAWSLPQICGDAAHILHYPTGVNPPYIFLLMHYRGRGTVFCSVPGNVD